MRESDCGGCKGQGAHSRRCRTQPGWLWERLLDRADELGDLIGSNDPAAANMAYAIAGRMKKKAEGAEMSDLSDNNPPYHLVQKPEYGGKHIGPFSSYLDAAMARRIAVLEWFNAAIMNNDEFNAHLEAS